MRLPQEWCSEEAFQLTDAGLLAVQKFLAKGTEFFVGLSQHVKVSDPLHHATGVAPDHHIRDLGAVPGAPKPHADHGVGHEPDRRIQLRQLPAPAAGKGMSLRFDRVIFLELCVQNISKRLADAGLHGCRPQQPGA